MQWAAFGLARHPFQRSAELDDACLPNTVSALLAELMSSLRSPQGLSVLVGEGGSGKTLAAGAFARRAGSNACVATISRPTSCVTAIARDALAQLDPDDYDFSAEEDWIPALRAWVERATRGGRTTVILLDDAHRLSPQTLQNLSEYFAEDEALRLHVFLFGRPKLLDRLQAGAEDALRSHLLQICRLEPLGVRESVRYLERRIAICGGELGSILGDEAIDDIVQKAGGCVIRLEELTVEAMKRAACKGRTRATVEDVVATARTANAEEEDDAMASNQQPLRFAIEEEGIEDEDVSWGDEDDEDALEWGDEPSDDGQEAWQADDAEEDDDEWQAEDEEEAAPLRWDAAPARGGRAIALEARDLDEDLDAEIGDDADDEDAEDDGPARREVPAASPRRRLMGPAVLTLAACLALVWAANQMPGPDEGERRGRDAVLFAEPLSSEPSQIMRLARTAEAADADAHVHIWKDQPPRPDSQAPVEKAVAAADRKKASQAAPGDDAFVGPLPARPAEVEVTAPAAKKDAVVASASAKPTAPKASPAKTVASRSAAKPAATAAFPKASAKKKSPVFTVQLGAFKARRNAEEMVTKLRGKSPRILQEGGLYRVISGSFASKKDAVIHEASLRRAGYTTYVRTAVF